MKFIPAATAILAGAVPACAQPLALTPLAEFRSRYEHVDQAGLATTASDAATFRLRGGLQAAMGRWSGLVEAQGVLAAIDDYYDGLHGAANRPQIGDPQNIALYRAQIRYAAPGLALTAGRQKIMLEDERFVGGANFRDSAQSFDAARAEFAFAKKLKLDLTYAWSVRTIWGFQGHGARPQAVPGDNLFATLSYRTSLGALTGFAYLIDQDDAAVQGFRLSNRTYGLRFAGSRPLGRGAKLSYQASYARQAGHHRNPNDYRADYYLADATLDLRGLLLNAGYEVLGAASGVHAGQPFTSFHTPLASVFKFQGWADRFTTTPPDGIRDLYGSIGFGRAELGPAKAVTVQAIHHRFRSDRIGRRYGSEWDALASARFGRTTISVRHANYRADTLFTDTRKLWLQMDWAL